MHSRAGDDEIMLAEISLSDCPLGTVLDPNEPDQRIEEEYFRGWTSPLTGPARWRRPSNYRVVPDGDRKVLEHINKTDSCLITGERLWADYSVEAQIRQLNPFTRPNNDDPHAIIGRSGLVLRYQDLRRNYLFCLEGHERVVLYRREDEAWTLLADVRNGVDRGRYYDLKAVCEAHRITCYVDGQHVFVVDDKTFLTGKAGVRTNTRSRMYGIHVATTEPKRLAYVNRLSAFEGEVAEAAEKYPKPVLWKRIGIEASWPCSVRFGDFRGAGKKEIILEEKGPVGPRITCLDLNGERQWDKHYPAAASLTRTVLHDLDADGVEDFIGIDQGRIRMVSGRTGEVIAETELPTTGPYRGYRRESVENHLHPIASLCACRIRKTVKAQDLILRDGDRSGSGFSIWAYDEHLNLRWRQDAHDTSYGMYIWFYDVDGDGRDEILPGYQLYDGDGNLLWVMETAEYIDDPGGGGHVDHAAFGELDGDESNGPEIGLAASDPGFFLVDARTGALLRHHRFGHVQGIYAGNFRPDLPGLEMWMGNRWGNYGILNLVSGEGDALNRFEPDNISQGGRAVNWSGEGEELLLLTSSQKALGLYDAQCRKVVTTGAEGLPEWGWHPGVQVIVEDVVGDARDELVFVRDGEISIYTQYRPFPKAQRIYAPIRRMDISLPGWKINDV